jgi:hypothetical protein
VVGEGVGSCWAVVPAPNLMHHAGPHVDAVPFMEHLHYVFQVRQGRHDQILQVYVPANVVSDLHPLLLC